MVIATRASTITSTPSTVCPSTVSVESIPTQTTTSNMLDWETLSLSHGLMESLMNGVLILTVQRELVYANDAAWRVLRQFTSVKPRENQVPQEIWHICEYLIHSRQMFPRQHWFMESEISTDETTALHIKARWFQVETIADPCLLLMLQDRYTVLKNWAVDEAKRYGLTPREKEAWLLHRANYTYKEIASELRITPNTVKKHMQSIHAKQKEAFGPKA